MTAKETPEKPQAAPDRLADAAENKTETPTGTGEVGGPKGPEPTRYGDWEKNGICSDF